MLSLDGFRWDYPERANTPVLDSLKKAGVMAASLKPSFPTKTFPNHYTLATGLYPDHHGLVLNRFYATDLKRDYALSDRSAVTDGAFYGGDPLWNLAERQGVTTATLFWVGASAAIDGNRPSHWSVYKEDLTMGDRIDSLVHWLGLPEAQRPHLVMWYYHEPDLTSHIYGPESIELVDEVEKLDSFLGNFFTAMRKLPVFDQLNFIITSDHGMAELSPDRQVLLDHYVDTADLEIINGGNPVYNFKVKTGKINEVFSQLKEAPHLQVWMHDSLPERLHYGTNPRSQDLTLVADPGWSVYWSWKIGQSKGTHGYDNDLKDMHAIFYAAGPAFKKGYLQPTFENVDIYPLVSKIMELNPGEVDGKLEHVGGMLK
ncbi:MAG: ectonucleotide pyrophosphatase/phosphodiesterase [Bacteroidales bacterium]|nr:ectonucleotide pyrophosphatase/phosphodiesterase [Bacteroidales bacterium]